jgi:uncharacterized protein with FMN-binding domain
MKRVIAAFSLTVAGLAALLGFKTRDASSEAATPPTTTIGRLAATTTGGGAPAEDTTTTTAAGAVATAAPATVQVDGPVVDTRFGPVQVAVVVADGVLVDVVALQLPSGDRESDRISAYAEPVLREMALAAQSAEIDVVSGATFTSRAYAHSLQAALDEAGM